MNLLQLKYFREVVLCGSVTKAARRLYVTQPAVSKQLRLLSDEMNCELWTKHNNKRRLTEAGRTIFQRAELILEQTRLMKKEVSELTAEKVSGSIVLGCGPLLARHFTPQLIVEFMQQYPKVNLSIYEADSILQGGLLEDGSIDLGLGAGNLSKSPKVKFTPLLKDEYLIIHSSKLVIPGEIFPIAQLNNYPFISYMPGSTVLAQLGKRLKMDKLDAILHARNVETVIEFVKRGLGIAFISSYLYRILKPEGIIAKRTDKSLFQNIGIYSLKEKNTNQAYNIFKTKVKDAFNKIN